MKPRILLIYTGGTIGMIESPLTGSLVPFDFSHLIDNVPKIKKLDYVIDNIQFEPIDSSDMNPEHWSDIAAAIADRYDDYDGFVVLHGTDTMAYTASALSFMLEGLTKPVIITGSQLPIGEVRTDGEENLLTAIQIAATTDPRDGQPMVREVAILFENYLWRGNRATKRSADDFNAFKSYNYPPLARIGLTISFNREALARPDKGSRLKLHRRLDSSVMVITLTPGLTARHLEHELEMPDIRGIVLRTYGGGNGPTAQWFVDALAKAVDRGLIIVNVSQCSNGGVSPSRYEAGRGMEAVGVVSGGDMTFEAALVKMMYVLAHNPENTPSARREIADALTKDMRGELTEAR